MPQAEARRDYELALQVGNKDALNAFLAQYPDGFYASLAKLQLDKIAAEEARLPRPRRRGWPNRSGRGLPPRARRRRSRSKAAEADAKAAEQARIAAEKAKQVAQDQAADAERKRVAAENACGDRRLRKQIADAPVTRLQPATAAKSGGRAGDEARPISPR